MEKLIVILFSLFSLVGFSQVRVPDTETFSLQHVINAVEDHAGDITNTLDDAFNNADAFYFDGNYDSDDYAPENSMKRFRNYGPSGIICGESASYSGGTAYPLSTYIDLGSGTGQVVLDYDVKDIPDLILVKFEGSIVINTRYRGHSNYDYGGLKRTDFKNSFHTPSYDKIDPVYGTTYPDYIHYPDDGYPRIQSPGDGSTWFDKTTSSTEAIVEVYGPMTNTEWFFILRCPVPF